MIESQPMAPWGLLCEKIGVIDQKPWARIEMTARLIVAIHNSIEIPQISLLSRQMRKLGNLLPR